MDKRFWAVLGVLAAVFVGIVIYSGHKDAPVAGTLTNHVEGNTKSSVKLVEYGDYQCPICGLYYPVVKQVFDTYQDKIAFQFRNFPISSAHPNAVAAARAAEAAGMQNKYWQMHDMLYENQDSWSSLKSPLSTFVSYAKGLGLNETKFRTDFASAKVNANINADADEGTKLGVDGTPSFFLNGQKVDLTKLVDSNNEPQVANFNRVIDAALAAKQ